MATVRIALDEVVGYFDELEDPRSTINQKHSFVSVVVIALMAVLAGASGPTTIAQWAEYKGDFLRKLLDLPNGVPRKEVFRRILLLLRPDAFQACFTKYGWRRCETMPLRRRKSTGLSTLWMERPRVEVMTAGTDSARFIP
jgi:hypothetical protein